MPKIEDQGAAWSISMYLSGAMARSARHSQTVRILRNLAPSARSSETPTNKLHTWFRLRRRIMQAREKSLTVRVLDGLRCVLLGTRLSSFGGGILLSLAVFCLCMGLGGHLPSVGEWSLVAALAAACIPMLASLQPLGENIAESRCCRFFLCEICAIAMDALTPPPLKRSARGLWLLGAVLGLAMSCFGLARVCICLLLLAGACLVLSVPELGVVAVFASFPFLQCTSHPTLFLALLILFCSFGWILKLLCGRRECAPSTVEGLVLLFLLLLLFGGGNGAGSPLEGILAASLVSFYFPVRYLVTGQWCRRLMTAAQLSALLTSAYGIWQYFFADLPLLWTDVERFGDIGSRVTSFFDNPNILAIYLLMMLPLSLAGLLLLRGGRGWRIFCLTTALFIIACILLTWSRGAWLGASFEILCALLLGGRRTRAILLLLPIPLLSLLPYLPHSITNRFLSIGSMSESSIRYRLETWQGVLRLIADHPYGIGVGESAFRAIYPRYAVSGTEGVMHAHNLFLQISVEIGLAGCLVFFCLLILLLCRGILFSSHLGGEWALFGILIMGLFDHIWYERGMSALFFAVCALTAIGRDHNGYRQTQAPLQPF